MAFIERIRSLPGFTSQIAEALGLAIPAVSTHREVRERAPVGVVTERRPVAAVPPERNRFAGLLPLLGVLALGLLGLMVWPRARTPEPPVPMPAVSTPATVPSLQTAVAERQADDILVLYEKGAHNWLSPIVEEFNKSHEGQGRLLMASMGSREGRDHVLYDKEKIKPGIWIPADDYWVDKLRMDAANPKIGAKSGATIEQSKPFLRTYIVMLMHEDRARLFEAAMNRPEYAGHTWKLMRDLATKGWSTIGGSADQGKLKLAMANPGLSNSGMEALTLMYREFGRDNPGASINSPGFLRSAGEVCGAVASYADTTSNALQAYIDNPDNYDAVIVYESDAARLLKQEGSGHRVIYPSPTAELTLPVSVVKAPWLTQRQEEIARDFIETGTAEEAQQRAFEQGYRPTVASLARQVETMVAGPEYKGFGMKGAPDTRGTSADTKTKEGLIYNWVRWHKQKYGTSPEGS
jgi:hypothetical protein